MAHTSWQGRLYVKKRAHLEVFEDRQANVRVEQQPIFGRISSEIAIPEPEGIFDLQLSALVEKSVWLGSLFTESLSRLVRAHTKVSLAPC